jgi:hypothetical protein
MQGRGETYLLLVHPPGKAEVIIAWGLTGYNNLPRFSLVLAALIRATLEHSITRQRVVRLFFA